jgi:hypothetical protein
MVKFVYRLIVAAGALAMASFAFGCGSSGNDATSAPLTKAQYLKEANSLCVELAKEREAAIASWKEEFATEAEADSHDGYKAVFGPALRHEAEELESLEPPAKDVERIARIEDSLSEVAASLEERGARALLHSGLPAYRSKALAYGLDKCAEF